MRNPIDNRCKALRAVFILTDGDWPMGGFCDDYKPKYAASTPYIVFMEFVLIQYMVYFLSFCFLRAILRNLKILLANLKLDESSLRT